MFNIKQKKVFTFKPPFDRYNTNKVLEVISTELISEMSISGDVILKTVYAPAALTRKDLEDDINNKVILLGLYAGVGKILYIPEKYVVLEPTHDSKTFAHKIITIDVGLVPTNLDLETITMDLRVLTENRCGIVPAIKVVTVSNEKEIPKDDYLDYELIREQRMSDEDNYYLELERVKRILIEKENTIEQLSCTIKKLDLCQ